MCDKLQEKLIPSLFIKCYHFREFLCFRNLITHICYFLKHDLLHGAVKHLCFISVMWNFIFNALFFSLNKLKCDSLWKCWNSNLPTKQLYILSSFNDKFRKYLLHFHSNSSNESAAFIEACSLKKGTLLCWVCYYRSYKKSSTVIQWRRN